jgi:RNA polymerase sigma-70 factor (ECF subfamily)
MQSSPAFLKPDDRDLIRQAAAGQEQAFAALMGRYVPRIFAFAFRLCGQRQDAEDLVQDTFLSALRSLSQYKGKAAFSTWLYTIAAHRCQRMRRLKSGEPRRKASLEAMAEAGQAMPATPQQDILDHLGSQQARQRLLNEIPLLPPEFKKVLVLRDLEGQDTAATAKILGMSQAAVKSRLHRARMELKRRLVP